MLQLSGTLRHLLHDYKVSLLFLVWRLSYTGWPLLPDLALRLNLFTFFRGVTQISSIPRLFFSAFFLGHGCDAFVRRTLEKLFHFFLFRNLLNLFELEGVLLFLGNIVFLSLCFFLNYLSSHLTHIFAQTFIARFF